MANGLKSATTTVAVSSATAPTTGQVLTATGGTAATWQTPNAVSITAATPDLVVTPSPITGTGTIGTTIPLNTQSGSSYAILTGDNTQIVEMTNASPTTMTIPVANSAGFTSGWGTSVVATLAPTTITPASGTICGQAAILLPANTFLSIGAGSGTNYDCAMGAGAIPMPTPGTSATLRGPRADFVCTSTCTVTLPPPVAGYKFCVMNDDNVTTVITLAALGSASMYENTARTAYGTAATGTLVSGGAAADRVCVEGRDSTHYLTVTFNGTWTAS